MRDGSSIARVHTAWVPSCRARHRELYGRVGEQIEVHSIALRLNHVGYFPISDKPAIYPPDLSAR